MKLKYLKTNFIGGISIVIILVVAMLITSSSSAASGSPFIGSWYGTDVDGNGIHLVIAGNPNGPFQITSTGSYISFCNGEAGIIKGTGSPNTENIYYLEADLRVSCFTTGDTQEFETSFYYDTTTDTLSGISMTWYRSTSNAPTCILPIMGLSGWWPGDGNAEDIKDHRTGTFMGDATTGPGLVDKAFLLDGDGDYIEVPDDPAMNFGTGDFTVDLWVNFNDLSGEQVLMEKWIQGYPISQGWTLTKINNQLYFVMDDGIGGEYLVGAELDIMSHTWYLFAVTRQGSTVTLYWDGMAVSSADFDPLNLDAPISLKFGRREGDQGFFLNGRIDEVEIYSGTALTQEQIFELYSAGRLGHCKNYINNPGIRAHPEWDDVDGWWWPEDKILTLTVDDPNTPKTPDIKMKKSGADILEGTVWFNFAGYDLKPGDIVTLTDGLLTKTLIVSNLTITSVDIDNDLVSGYAEPGREVRLPYSPEGISVFPDSDGNWSVDLGSYGYDIQSGSMLIAEEFDPDGDLTSFEYQVRNPRIQVQISDNWFAVQDFPPNADLTYSIYSEEGGELLLGPTPIHTDDSWSYLIDVSGLVELHPGYFVVVTGASVTKSITLEAISFDVFDPTSGYFRGSAPEPFGRDVWVGVGWVDHYWSTVVNTDGSGNWFASYDGQVPGDWVWVAAQIFDEDGDVSEVRPAPPSQVLGNFTIAWNQFKPEEVIYLSWKGSGNLTISDGGEFFGDGWTSEGANTPEFFFREFTGWCTTGDWSQAGLNIDINSISSGCYISANVPVHTIYQFSDSRLDLIKIERTFEFGEDAYDHTMRAFIPRLSPKAKFWQVIYPKDDGSGLEIINVTDTIYGYGQILEGWNGSWFAMNDPTKELGMIVQRVSSPYEVALWAEGNDSTQSNASSYLLFPPGGGFTGSVTETEYLCFYDSSTWTPSLILPIGCHPE